MLLPVTHEITAARVRCWAQNLHSDDKRTHRKTLYFQLTREIVSENIILTQEGEDDEAAFDLDLCHLDSQWSKSSPALQVNQTTSWHLVEKVIFTRDVKHSGDGELHVSDERRCTRMQGAARENDWSVLGTKVPEVCWQGTNSRCLFVTSHRLFL